MSDYLLTISAQLDAEPECECGHDRADHWFGCEALPDEECPCTAIYPEPQP